MTFKGLIEIKTQLRKLKNLPFTMLNRGFSCVVPQILKPSYYNKTFLFMSKGPYWLISDGSVSFYLLVPKSVGVSIADYLMNLSEPYDRYSKVKRGDVVFDVGASIGEQAVMYAKKVGSEGLIIAVEPSMERVSYLKKNIAINHLGNIKLLEGAVWNTTGVIELEAYGRGPEGFKIAGRASKLTKVKAYTLDKIACDFGVEKVDFLKMDIEGSEVEALKGISLPLRNVAIETHTIRDHKTTFEVCRVLKKRKFEIRVQYKSSQLDMVYAWKG